MRVSFEKYAPQKLGSPGSVIDMIDHGMYSGDEEGSRLPEYMDFYFAHTDQFVNGRVAETVTNIPGIEAFAPLSPYRFVFAVGKQFKTEDVKIKIEESLL